MNKYDEDYYENGVQLGISGYANYRWMPSLTIPMAERMIEYLAIKETDKILDFGCAKGFLVKAFTDLGYKCEGVTLAPTHSTKHQKRLDLNYLSTTKIICLANFTIQ